MLSIKTFGSLQVCLEGETLELPASRKTRALLAYLVLSGNPQRRERLCELFWETPDDPRGALRWSLSKLRAVLNTGNRTRLIADRERVQVDAESITVDFHELRVRAKDDNASQAEIARAWETASQLPMGDCDLPDQVDFTAWLEHHRNETRGLRARLAQRLALSPDLPVEQAEKWAQRWLHDAPADPLAAQQAVAAKRRVGGEQDAAALACNLKSAFREAGLEPPDSAGPEVPVGLTRIEGAAPVQTVRLIHASDMTALACAFVGAASNAPLVKTGGWLTHLQLDWEAPAWSPLFRDLARSFHFIRYDERGCGLSDWDTPEIGFDALVSDLESVVDAAGVERFALLGVSDGAAVAIEFAARYPERVSHLVLFGGYAAGWRHTATGEEARAKEALMVLLKAGWGKDDLAYQGFLSRSFMPDANPEELRWLDAFQRQATSPRNACRSLEAFSRIDVRSRLKDVKAPTLVIHSRGDLHVPVSEGREIAARIPNAEFLGLCGSNHLLLAREGASNEFLRAVRRFLKAT